MNKFIRFVSTIAFLFSFVMLCITISKIPYEDWGLLEWMSVTLVSGVILGISQQLVGDTDSGGRSQA